MDPRRQKGATSASGEQSWHSLTGSKTRTKPFTPEAKKKRLRKLLKICAITFVVAVLFAVLLAALRSAAARSQASRIAPPSRPIERILYATDGVLPNEWLSSMVQLKRGTRLAEADIHLIKTKLEAVEQVYAATVERVFPDALRIEIEEQYPIMRLVIMGPDQRRQLRIVSRNGTIYSGVGYTKSALLKLPFLSPYFDSQGQYKPLRGIEHVAQLLESCQREYPEEYRQWQVISLEDYTGNLDLPGERIEVRAAQRLAENAAPLKTRLVFSATTDFKTQLDRLRHIREVGASLKDHLMSADLSLRDAAAVQFQSGRTSLY